MKYEAYHSKIYLQTLHQKKVMVFPPTFFVCQVVAFLTLKIIIKISEGTLLNHFEGKKSYSTVDQAWKAWSERHGQSHKLVTTGIFNWAILLAIAVSDEWYKILICRERKWEMKYQWYNVIAESEILGINPLLMCRYPLDLIYTVFSKLSQI